MVDVKNWWLTCIEDETLHNMHRDLLRHGVFDSSDEGRLTTLALVAIKKRITPTCERPHHALTFH